MIYFAFPSCIFSYEFSVANQLVKKKQKKIETKQKINSSSDSKNNSHHGPLVEFKFHLTSLSK